MHNKGSRRQEGQDREGKNIVGNRDVRSVERADELLVSQRPSTSSAQLCLRTSSFSWVTSDLEVGGRICTPATVKPFIPQNILKEI